MDVQPREREPVPWGTRLLAGLGFLLAALMVLVGFSRQVAIAYVQGYVRQKYRVNVEVPVRRIRPDFVSGPAPKGKKLPPLGFCWTVELEAGPARGEVTVNPWTHEIIDWDAGQ